MADIKLSTLPTTSNVVSTDGILILYNAVSNSQIANGSPSTRIIEVGDLAKSLNLNFFTPPSSQSPGTQGNISYDNNFLYICVANNVWARTTLNTW